MKLLKRFLLGIGGLSLLTGAGLLVAPRAAHAIAAALVQVTNTTANPAITLDSARAASQIIHLSTLNHSTFGPQQNGFLHPVLEGGVFKPQYVVPSGQNLVITSIEVSVLSAGSNYLIIYDDTLSERAIWYLPNVGTQQFVFPSGLVFPAGSWPVPSVGGTGGSQMNIDVHGYLTVN